MNICQISTTG